MRKKLVLIQLSRALVPLLVMLHHLSTTMMDYYGYNIWGLSYLPLTGGVYYFFSLSGFMAYYIYRNKFGRRDELPDFLINRFIRIYPLYWVVTIVFLLLAFAFPWFATGAEQDLGVILTSIFLIPNSQWQDPFVIVAWSLEFTVYFYLIFSLLFLSPRWIGRLAFGAWGAFSVLAVWGFVYIDSFLFDFLFSSVNLMFLAGVACAWFVLRFRIPLVYGYAFAAIGLIGFPVTWLNSLHGFMNISFEASAGVAIVFLLIGLGGIDLKQDIRIPNFLHELGNAAFSIYLVHNIVLDLFSEWMDRWGIYGWTGGFGMSALLFGLMIFAGVAAHRKVELPLHALFKKWLLRKKTTSPEASGMKPVHKNR